jgi:hypothetical protein
MITFLTKQISFLREKGMIWKVSIIKCGRKGLLENILRYKITVIKLDLRYGLDRLTGVNQDNFILIF